MTHADPPSCAVRSKAAAKLGSRATEEGRIAVVVTGPVVGLAEIACETDFVARTEVVDNLVTALATAAAAAGPTAGGGGAFSVAVDEVLAAPGMTAGVTLADDVRAAIASVGENIVVRRAGAFATAEPAVVGTYIHGVGTYAAVVGLGGVGGGGASVQRLADQLAQHIVAIDPGEAGLAGLLETPFMFGGDTTVREAAAAEGAELTGYVRWAIAKFDTDNTA